MVRKSYRLAETVAKPFTAEKYLKKIGLGKDDYYFWKQIGKALLCTYTVFGAMWLFNETSPLGWWTLKPVPKEEKELAHLYQRINYPYPGDEEAMTDFIAKGGMIGTMVSAKGTIEMDQGAGNYQKQLQKEKFDQEANKLWLRMKNEVVQELREKGLKLYTWRRWIGDLVHAVVPFMGESITDGTLAAFLKKPGDRVEIDEPIAQVETDKVTIDVASPEAGIIQEFVAKEGDTVEPGTKTAIISKSAEGAAAPPKKASEEAVSQPPPPAAEKVEEKPKSKVEAAPVAEKPKPSSPPPPSRTSASEPQLPPKERERRFQYLV